MEIANIDIPFLASGLARLDSIPVHAKSSGPRTLNATHPFSTLASASFVIMVVEVLFMDSSEQTIDNSSVVFVMDRNEVSFDARSDDGIDLVGGSRITANFVLSMSRTNFIFDASMLQKIGISLVTLF